jgi:CheY-like chemotaxis protein/PAS domain-containing protein
VTDAHQHKMSTQEQLLKALDEPVFELDTAGKVVYATNSLHALTGRETGFSFAETLIDSDRARFFQLLKRLADGKTASALADVTMNINGTPQPMELKLAASQREAGKVTKVAGWLRDISMEKAKEAAANVQGTHLLDLVENISDACVVENGAGEVEMVNTAFCELFRIELAPQSLVGMPCGELFAQATAVTEKKIAPIYFPLESVQQDEFEFEFAGGRSVKQHSLPVAGETGIAGRLHIFSAREAEAANPAASATIAAQSQMVEKIARELAIAVESAASAVLRAEQLDLPGAILEHFRRVEHAAKAALAEIANLLEFSQFDSSDIKLESMEFHLRNRIANLLARMMPMAEERSIQMRLSVEQDVPEHLVGDGARLMLVLRSLIESGLSNASGGGEIAVVVEPEYSADHHIHLSFRVESTPAKGKLRQKDLSPAGQLQLSLARQIVRAMGVSSSGKIEVRERKEATICQFTAVFPYRERKDPRTRPTFVTLTGLPVLIVSADAAQRKKLSDLARNWRMHPREADTAAVALQLLIRMAEENVPIPLVLTSNQLPVQDGFLLAFRIKHHPRLKQTAIIMLATAGKPGDAIFCRENGISAYLRDPIADNQLNEAIAAVMGTEEDAEETSTLITRHSLREAKAGSVLIVDPDREHAIVAIGAMRKRDYRVVHTDTADEAFVELAQDVFDLLIIDPMAKGFAELGPEGIAEKLRAKFAESSAPIPVLVAVHGDVPPAESGFNGVVSKPYNRDVLLRKVAALIPAKPAH